MTEAERLAELERLIDQQQKDDTYVVFPEGKISLDAPFQLADGAADGFSNLIGVDMEGEVVSFVRERRGSVLVGGASYHGTIGGYSNHKCRCPRCRKVWNAHYAAYMRKRRRNRPPIPCPTCGEEFRPFSNRVYCSDQCRDRAQKRRLAGMPEADPIRTCEECGGEFKAVNLKKKFCTAACRIHAWKRHLQAEAAA